MPYIRTEFSEKNFLKNKEMVFGNGVKNIQAAAYNGARTVPVLRQVLEMPSLSFPQIPVDSADVPLH